MSDLGRQARKVADGAEDAADSKPFIIAARAGYVAAGLLHILIGVIAVRVASGGSGSPDQAGAMSSLASTPFGGILLWACAIGCCALALFLLSEVFFPPQRLDGKEDVIYRLKNGGKAVVYAAIGIGFALYALGVLGILVITATVTHDPEKSSGLDGALKSLQEQPFGVYILGAVALGLIAYGVFMVVRSRYQRM